MKLSKVNLSNLVAIAHDEDFQLGLLLDRGDDLEYVEIPAPVEAYDGLQTLDEAIGAERPVLPNSTQPVLPATNPPIPRQPVKSTMARSLGYDRDRALLQVEFQSGAVYQYEGVDEDTWDAFRTSDSTGAFFNQAIKGNYHFQQVQPPTSFC
ncbi:MAG: KTSC domain-containing protein [Cyanothece sp. SIO2G6]|nr:KTSC domain-containing protein [Cyanothece sp. SIO2G6]